MNLLEKLLAIQVELKAPKSQFNKFGNYAYRSCEDIQEALKPLLSKYKATIFISDDIVHIEGRFYVKSTITILDVETGDKLENTAFAREEETLKGQISSQITGGTSSYARKYALNGMFAIDDTKDADGFNKHGKEEQATPTNGINESQIKRLFAIAYKKGVPSAKVEQSVRIKFNCSVSELSKDKYDKVVNGYESLADK